MRLKKSDMVDYSGFRLSRINEERFKHIKLFMFWAIAGLLFVIVERFWIYDSFYPMHSKLDDIIPFCEFFLIPYVFWYLYVIGGVVYSLLFDVQLFKKLMTFIIISYSFSLLVYFVFPNCQELRPTVFERDNILTDITKLLYTIDTPTNVCPSVHVIGSFAALFCGWNSKHFSSVGWKIALSICSFLTAISTVFMKQHSILDVYAGIIVSVVVYIIAFYVIKYDKKPKTESVNS